MKIILIGFATTYKSTVGKILAQKLNLPLFDVDSQIEHSQGKTIPHIFAEQGEEYFRKCESQMLSVCPSTAVVSCGGGTPLSQNFSSFCQNSIVIWLTATAKTVISRLGSPARPLFDGLTIEQIAQKIEQRNAVYKQFASVVLSTDGKTSNQVADEILSLSAVKSFAELNT